MGFINSKTYKQSAFILTSLMAISVFFTEWRFPLSILIGGLVGIGNIKGIEWSANAILGTKNVHIKMVVLSMFRLLIIFSALIILAIFKVINAYGFLIGFTVVLIIIVKEGLTGGKDDKD